MTTLIVVVKNPVPGAVKTRLQTRYTPEQAAKLYTAFVKDTLDVARSIPIDNRIIAFDPPDAQHAVRQICGEDWRYIPQVQEDLGQRMYQALLHALNSGSDRAVLIGTDIPSLPANHLIQAFDILKTQDVVLGPSTDGGYYLIGLSKPCPEIFEHIPWSTPTVLSETILSLRKQNHAFGLVPTWFDVDTPEELEYLIAHTREQMYLTQQPTLKHTLACLSSLT